MSEIFSAQDDGTPANSISIILREEVLHGPIVGIIHRINSDDEDTMIFHQDGFIHQVSGLGLGEMNENFFAFLFILQRLVLYPAFKTAQSLSDLANPDSDEKFIEHIKEGNTIYFLFRPMEEQAKKLIFNINESLGVINFNDEVKTSYENDDIVIWEDGEYDC